MAILLSTSVGTTLGSLGGVTLIARLPLKLVYDGDDDDLGFGATGGGCLVGTGCAWL